MRRFYGALLAYIDFDLPYTDDDVQSKFDLFYNIAHHLLSGFYPVSYRALRLYTVSQKRTDFEAVYSSKF